MRERMAAISASYPYLVYLVDDEVAGYCYAHAWKERAAYRYTLETTVYLSPGYKGKGIGRLLMERLIEECRAGGFHALIARGMRPATRCMRSWDLGKYPISRR